MNPVYIGNRQSAIKGDVFVVLRHVGSISGIAAHEDGYIATVGDDGRVILWEKVTGESVNSSLHDDVVNDCAFSRDGRYLVTSSNDCTARLWSMPDLSLKAVLAGHGDYVTMSAFHPVDELIATASQDYFVRAYDFDARLVVTFGAVVGEVVWLDWTRDGRQLVALNDDGKMSRWSWAAAQPIDTIGHGSCSGRHKLHNIGAGERKRVHERRRQRAHGGHKRKYGDGSCCVGPAGRCADPSQYVLAFVRRALSESNGTLRRTQRLEGLTVHVQGRRPSRRLRIGLPIDRGRHVAVAQLREIRGELLSANVIALQLNPSGARAERARELTELIADALAHVERLMFFVEGDGC